MSDLIIGAETQVTLHFAIRLEDGQEVDSNFKGQPATFTVGDGNLLPGFEEALFGLKTGDRKTLSLPPEKAFGQSNPSNIQTFKREQFPADQDLQPGLVMTFNDAANTELPGVVSAITDGEVTVDFNHPLAGRTLDFEVEIVSVQPAGAAS